MRAFTATCVLSKPLFTLLIEQQFVFLPDGSFAARIASFCEFVYISPSPLHSSRANIQQSSYTPVHQHHSISKMDNALFCCPNAAPHDIQPTDYDPRISAFITWAKNVTESTPVPMHQAPNFHYIIQLAERIKFGPIDSKRSFVPQGEDDCTWFYEINDSDMTLLPHQEPDS